MAEVEAFRNHIIDAGVLDPEGVHHSFDNGFHGQKLDFEKIPIGGSLYKEWTLNVAEHIESLFPNLPEIILGVANGANRLAIDTAQRLGGRVIGAISKKDPKDRQRLYIPAPTALFINHSAPKLVVVVEDVGTTGANATQIATQAKRSGAEEVAVVSTWQRREKLQCLEEAGIAYSAVINEPVATYTEEECQASGPCADDWQLLRS